MKTTSFFKSALAATIIASVPPLFTSCDKGDDPEPPKPPVEAKTVSFAAQSHTDWTYFSFAEGKVITVDQAGFKTDAKWDMGFKRFYIRTNGGASGNGQGAAYDTGAKSFDAVTAVDASKFVHDSEVTVMDTSTMPPKSVKELVNSAFTIKVGDKNNLGWANYAPPSGPWTFNNNVFVVRTADGKFAKVIMKTFLNDEDKSGYITFEYIYPFE
jgi:hypothetical protein